MVPPDGSGNLWCSQITNGEHACSTNFGKRKPLGRRVMVVSLLGTGIAFYASVDALAIKKQLGLIWAAQFWVLRPRARPFRDC